MYEAFFKLSDVTGFSPEKKVVSGQGHETPCALPDVKGFYTLIKVKRKSLDGDIQVNLN